MFRDYLGRGHFNLLALDTLPFNEDGAEERHASHGNSDVEGVGDCRVVGDPDERERGLVDDVGEVRGSRLDDIEGVDPVYALGRRSSCRRVSPLLKMGVKLPCSPLGLSTVYNW